MTAIYQSPFLLALGWAIAASLWQTALLWMVYQILTNASNKLTPAAKHNMAFTSMLFAFGWFGITLSSKYNEFRQALPETDTLSLAGTTVTTTVDGGGFALTTFLNQYLPYISASYLLVLALLAARLIKAYFYAQQIKTKGLIEIDEYWVNQVDRYTGYLRIQKKVRIYLSSYIDVPATLNFFKPVILLPVAAFTQLTPQQVESIVLHELAHIKRNDYIINIVVSVIETMLFFNPFVYLLGKSLKKEREHCCDDFVLHFRFDPHSYASALLSLEKLRMHTTPVGAIAATGNSRQLLGRVKRIMNVKSAGFNYGQKLLVLLITACILISVAWLSPNAVQNSAGDEKPAITAAVEEECAEPAATPLEAQTGKQMEIRKFTRKPGPVNDPAVVKAVKPLASRTTLTAATMAVPASPMPATLPAPQGDRHTAPIFPEIVTGDMPETFFWNEDVEDVYKQLASKEMTREAVKARKEKAAAGKNVDKGRVLAGFAELFKEKSIDLKNHELKLHQLEQLLNTNFFENVHLDFDGGGTLNVDVNIKKTAGSKQGKQEDKINQRKSSRQFEWNDERTMEQQKMQLDSIRERSIRIAERQKQLWVKKTAAARKAENAIQQTYLKIIDEHERNEKAANIRRSATLAASTNTYNADAHNTITDGNSNQYKRRSVETAVSTAQQQISRVVIDTGKGNKTLVISIE